MWYSLTKAFKHADVSGHTAQIHVRLSLSSTYGRALSRFPLPFRLSVFTAHVA